MKQQKKDHNNKLAILDKAKVIVRAQGWSKDVIDKLIEQKVNTSNLTIYFENNYKSLIQFSIDELNSKLEIQIKKTNILNFPTNKKIKKILLFRLNIINDDLMFYKKTFNHLLIPKNLEIMKKSLYRSVDNMWYLGGDNSTDFNFYTKRIILAIIYINSLFVLFNKNIEHAEKNVDKNLKKISKFPKLKNRLSFIKDNLPIYLRGILN